MNTSIKVLFVGLNTIDLQYFVKGHPKANTKIKSTFDEMNVGGPATNAAITCAFLGADTTLLSPIGNHSMSKFCADEISKYHINLVDPIHNLDIKPVFASIITDELNGNRTIFSCHPKQDYDILQNVIHLLNLETFHIALFDGFYPHLSLSIIKKLKEIGITTVLDGGSWKPGIEELLPFVDIAICSNDFIPPGTVTKYEIVNKLNEFGIQNIAITRGDKPIQIFVGKKHTQIPVQKVDVVDTLGAGDVFHGAFCHYFAFNSGFEQAIKNAASIASFSCQYKGTRNWMHHFAYSPITK